MPQRQRDHARRHAAHAFAIKRCRTAKFTDERGARFLAVQQQSRVFAACLGVSGQHGAQLHPLLARTRVGIS